MEDNIINEIIEAVAPEIATPEVEAVANEVVEAVAPIVAKKVKATVEKIAIHSSKDFAWAGVGAVTAGINYVEKELADKWLKRGHVRLAKTEELNK